MIDSQDIIRAVSPLLKLYHRLKVKGFENIPPEGQGFIIAPNHTNWFGWDGLLISSALPERKINWVSWSYPDEHPEWDRLVEFFGSIMYNKSRPFPYKDVSENILGRGGIVGLFPEGNNNTVADWYRLRPFMPGIIRLAVMAGVPIVPCAVAGLEEASPIFWAKEEEKEPISMLIALPILLPTGVTMHFGKPKTPAIKRENLDDRDALIDAASEIQKDVLKLLRLYRPTARADAGSSK